MLYAVPLAWEALSPSRSYEPEQIPESGMSLCGRRSVVTNASMPPSMGSRDPAFLGCTHKTLRPQQ